MDRQTDRQMDRQTDKQIDRQTNRWIDRQTGRQISMVTYIAVFTDQLGLISNGLMTQAAFSFSPRLLQVTSTDLHSINSNLYKLVCGTLM